MSDEVRIIEALGVESRTRMALMVLDGWKFRLLERAAAVAEYTHYDVAGRRWHATKTRENGVLDRARSNATLKVLLDAVWFDYNYHKGNE